MVDQPVQPWIGVTDAGRATGATAERDGLSAGLVAHGPQLRRDQVERLVPADPLPARVRVTFGTGAPQRIVDSVRMIVNIRRGPALGADGPAPRVLAVWLQARRQPVLDGHD